MSAFVYFCVFMGVGVVLLVTGAILETSPRRHRGVGDDLMASGAGFCVLAILVALFGEVIR